MGFNFTGIAISRNCRERTDFIEKIIRKKVKLKEEIYFENAMSYHKPDKTCDIYFSDNCTIVFFSELIEPNINRYSKNKQIISFVVSETSMIFSLEVSKNEIITRKFTEFNNDRINDYGDKFPKETQDSDGLNSIFLAIENTIGKSVWSIGVNEKAFRYIAT